MTLEEISFLAAAVSAVVATLTFIVFVWNSLSASKNEEKRDWQRVVISEIFQQHPEKFFSFAELLEKYRSASVDYNGTPLKRSELTKNALRRIIVDLVSSRIIDQFHEDRYKLNSTDWDEREEKSLAGLSATMHEVMGPLVAASQKRSTDAMQKLMGERDFGDVLEEVISSQMSKQEAISASVMNFFHENPARYSGLEAAAKLTSELTEDVAVIQAKVNELLVAGTLSAAPDGKISVTSNFEIGNEGSNP